jgi:hypothetical protein
MAKMAEAGHEVLPLIMSLDDEDAGVRAAKIGGWKKPKHLDGQGRTTPDYVATQLTAFIGCEWTPRLALIPSGSEMSLRRRTVSDAACASLYTVARKLCSIRAYEIHSNGWPGKPFQPDHYETLSLRHWNIKRDALEKAYAHILPQWPEQLSLKNIESLGRTRGAAVSASCAEAFKTIREVR